MNIKWRGLNGRIVKDLGQGWYKIMITEYPQYYAVVGHNREIKEPK